MDRKEFYSKLSDEVKAKIKACKTEEEMLQVLQDEKTELAPELMEIVNGGFTWLRPGETDEKEGDSCVCD